MIIEAPIDLELTQMSGQTSQPPWAEADGCFSNVVLVDGKPVIFNVRQSGDFLDFDFDGDISQREAVLKLNYIFDLDYDLNRFYKYLANHEELREMPEFCNGLRLFLAPDPFECVISSICSANNSSNISDIESCCNNLKSCGVGYRAPYMRKASEMFTDEMDLNEIFKMSYDEAFETILKVPGVGPKVADCILLYGFNFREAFPSDVWIKRIVSHLYFDGKDISVSKVREFGMEEFGDMAGYVQLYMFHYARKSGLMAKLK